MVDIDDLKANFLNSEFDRKDFVLSRDNLVIAATTSGESRPQYIDPEHPDFQAAPAFLCSLASGKHLPIDFPALGGVPIGRRQSGGMFRASAARHHTDWAHALARHLR